MRSKILRHNGYGSCVHSRKRKIAPWRVLPSCSNPLVQPVCQLPYPLVCSTCTQYQEEEGKNESSPRKGGGRP